MGKTIYYFSATGNSLQTALDIAEGIGDTEVFSIAKAGRNVKSDSEVIGFVYPVFAGGLPNIVHDFIQSGNWRKDAYIFSIATCGMSAGGANYEIDKLLRQQGTYLSYGIKLCVGTNYVVSNSCIVCGQCSSICPAKNIHIIDGKPKFLHHCEHCLSCVHWCPQKAINVLDKTQNRNRYHHPKINIEQIKQNL